MNNQEELRCTQLKDSCKKTVARTGKRGEKVCAATPGPPGRNLSRAEQYTGKEVSEKAQNVLHKREEQLRDNKEEKFSHSASSSPGASVQFWFRLEGKTSGR